VAGTRFSPGRGGVNVLVGYDVFGHAISANYPGQRFDLTRVSSWIEKNYNPSGRPLDPATEAERSKVERKIVQGSAYGDDGKLVNVALVFDGEGRQVLTASGAKDRHINIHELTVNTPSSLVRIHEFIEFYGNQGAYFSFTPMFDQTGGIAQALLRRDSATGKLTAELTEAGKLNYSAFETQSAHAANHAMKFKPFETSPFGSVIDGFVSYKTGTEVLYAQSNDGSSDMRLFVNQDHTQLMGQAFGSLDRVASMQWLMVDYTLEGVGTYGGFLRPNATNTLRVLQDASGNAVAYLSTVERQTYDAKTHGTASFAHSALGAKGPVNLYADAVYQYRSGDSVETHYFQGETLTGININGMWLAVHDGEYSVLLKTANGQNFNDGVFYALTQKGQWIGGFDLNGNALYLQNNSATQAQARLREEQLNKKTPLYGQGKDGALEINGNELGISTSADRMLMNASGRTQIYLSEAAASGDRSVVAAFNGLDLNTNGWSALTYLKTDAYTISRLQKVAGVFQIEANGSTYLAHQMGWKPDQFVDRDTNGTLLDARESNHGFKLENGGSVSEQINLNGKSGVYVQFAGPESSKYPEQGLRLFLNESGAGYSLVASFKGIYSGSTDMDALNTLNAKQVLSVITDTLALRAHDVGSFGRVFDIHYTADKKQKVVALEGDGGIFEIPKMTSSITHDAFKAQLGRAGNYFNELSQSVVAGTTGSALPADWSTAEINNAFVTSLRSESGQRLDLMFNFDANGSFRPIYEKTNYDDGFEEKITIGNHNYVENWSTKTEAKWVSGASAGVGGPGGYLSHYIVRDKTLNRQWFEDGTLQSAWISQTGNFYTGDQLFFSDLGRTWFVLAGNPQAGFALYSLRPFDETVRMDYQNGYLKEHISGSIIDNGNVIISEMVISTNAANRSEKYYWFDKGFLQEKWTVMPTAGEHTKDLSLWGGGNEKFTITFNEHGQITHLNQLNDNDFSNRTFTYDSSNYLYAVEQQIAADRNIVHAIDYFDTEGRYERTELLYQHYVTFGELSLGQQAAQVGIIAGAVVVAGLVIYFSGGTATGVVATLGAKFALGGMIGASVLAYGAGAYYFGQESGLWGVSGGGEFAMQMAPVLATLPFMGLTSLTLTRAMVMTAARTGAYTSLTGLTIGAGTGLSLGALDRELKDIPAPIVSLFRVVSFGSFDTFYGIGRNGLSAQNWRAVAGELSVSAAIGFATGTTLRLFRPEVALTKSALPTRVAGFGIQKGITAVTYTSAGIALASGVVHAITGDALSAKISQLFSQVTVVGFLALQGPGLLLSRGFLTAGGIGLSAIFIDTLTGNHGAAWLIDMENGGTSVNLLRALLGMDVSEKAETIYSWRYALFAGSLVLGTKLLTRGVSWASRFSNVLSKTFKGAASLEVSAELRVATKAAAHWDAVKALRGAESWSWMGAGKAAGVVWHSLAGGFRSGQALLLQTTSAHRFTGFLLNKMGSGFYYAARWMAQGSEWGSKALGSFKASLGRSFKNEKWVKSGEQMVRTARIQEMKLRLSFKKDFNVSNEKLNTIRNFVASRAGDKLEFGALRAKLINKVKNVFGAGEIQILNSVNQIETVTAGRELTLAGNTVPTLITRAGIAQHAWLGEVNGIRSFFGTESILSYKILMGSGSGMLNEFFRIAKFNLYLAPFGLMQSVTNVNNKTDSVMDQLFGALGFSVYEKQLAKDAFGRAMKDEHGNDIQENKVGEDGRLVWKNAYQIYRDDFLRGYGFEGGVLTPHGVSMAFATASVFYIASPLMERFAQTMLGTLGRFEASFNKFLKTHFRSLDSVLSKTGLSLTGVIDRELIVKMSASVYEETIIEPIFKSVYSMTVTSFSFALASLLTKGLSDETPGGQQLHGLTAAALAGQIQRMLLPLGDYLAEFTTPGGPVSISGVTALSDTARALGQSSLHVAARAGITLGDARSSLDFQAAGITDAVMSRLGITNDTLLLDVYDRLQQGLAFAPALSGALNSPEGFADFMNGTQGAAAIAFLGSVDIITGVTPTMPSTEVYQQLKARQATIAAMQASFASESAFSKTVGLDTWTWGEVVIAQETDLQQLSAMMGVGVDEAFGTGDMLLWQLGLTAGIGIENMMQSSLALTTDQQRTLLLSIADFHGIQIADRNANVGEMGASLINAARARLEASNLNLSGADFMQIDRSKLMRAIQSADPSTESGRLAAFEFQVGGQSLQLDRQNALLLVLAAGGSVQSLLETVTVAQAAQAANISVSQFLNRADIESLEFWGGNGVPVRISAHLADLATVFQTSGSALLQKLLSQTGKSAEDIIQYVLNYRDLNDAQRLELMGILQPGASNHFVDNFDSVMTAAIASNVNQVIVALNLSIMDVVLALGASGSAVNHFTANLRVNLGIQVDREAFEADHTALDVAARHGISSRQMLHSVFGGLSIDEILRYGTRSEKPWGEPIFRLMSDIQNRMILGVSEAQLVEIILASIPLTEINRISGRSSAMDVLMGFAKFEAIQSMTAAQARNYINTIKAARINRLEMQMAEARNAEATAVVRFGALASDTDVALAQLAPFQEALRHAEGTLAEFKSTSDDSTTLPAILYQASALTYQVSGIRRALNGLMVMAQKGMYGAENVFTGARAVDQAGRYTTVLKDSITTHFESLQSVRRLVYARTDKGYELQIFGTDAGIRGVVSEAEYSKFGITKEMIALLDQSIESMKANQLQAPDRIILMVEGAITADGFIEIQEGSEIKKVRSYHQSELVDGKSVYGAVMTLESLRQATGESAAPIELTPAIREAAFSQELLYQAAVAAALAANPLAAYSQLEQVALRVILRDTQLRITKTQTDESNPYSELRSAAGFAIHSAADYALYSIPQMTGLFNLLTAPLTNFDEVQLEVMIQIIQVMIMTETDPRTRRQLADRLNALRVQLADVKSTRTTANESEGTGAEKKAERTQREIDRSSGVLAVAAFKSILDDKSQRVNGNVREMLEAAGLDYGLMTVNQSKWNKDKGEIETKQFEVRRVKAQDSDNTQQVRLAEIINQTLDQFYVSRGFDAGERFSIEQVDVILNMALNPKNMFHLVTAGGGKNDVISVLAEAISIQVAREMSKNDDFRTNFEGKIAPSKTVIMSLHSKVLYDEAHGVYKKNDLVDFFESLGIKVDFLTEDVLTAMQNSAGASESQKSKEDAAESAIDRLLGSDVILAEQTAMDFLLNDARINQTDDVLRARLEKQMNTKDVNIIDPLLEQEKSKRNKLMALHEKVFGKDTRVIMDEADTSLQANGVMKTDANDQALTGAQVDVPVMVHQAIAQALGEVHTISTNTQAEAWMDGLRSALLRVVVRTAEGAEAKFKYKNWISELTESQLRKEVETDYRGSTKEEMEKRVQARIREHVQHGGGKGTLATAEIDLPGLAELAARDPALQQVIQTSDWAAVDQFLENVSENQKDNVKLADNQAYQLVKSLAQQLAAQTGTPVHAAWFLMTSEELKHAKIAGINEQKRLEVMELVRQTRASLNGLATSLKKFDQQDVGLYAEIVDRPDSIHLAKFGPNTQEHFRKALLSFYKLMKKKQIPVTRELLERLLPEYDRIQNQLLKANLSNEERRKLENRRRELQFEDHAIELDVGWIEQGLALEGEYRQHYKDLVSELKKISEQGYLQYLPEFMLADMVKVMAGNAIAPRLQISDAHEAAHTQILMMQYYALRARGADGLSEFFGVNPQAYLNASQTKEGVRTSLAHTKVSENSIRSSRTDMIGAIKGKLQGMSGTLNYASLVLGALYGVEIESYLEKGSDRFFDQEGERSIYNQEAAGDLKTHRSSDQAVQAALSRAREYPSNGGPRHMYLMLGMMNVNVTDIEGKFKSALFDQAGAPFDVFVVKDAVRGWRIYERGSGDYRWVDDIKSLEAEYEKPENQSKRIAFFFTLGATRGVDVEMYAGSEMMALLNHETTGFDAVQLFSRDRGLRDSQGNFIYAPATIAKAYQRGEISARTVQAIMNDQKAKTQRGEGFAGLTALEQSDYDKYYDSFTSDANVMKANNKGVVDAQNKWINVFHRMKIAMIDSTRPDDSAYTARDLADLFKENDTRKVEDMLYLGLREDLQGSFVRWIEAQRDLLFSQYSSAKTDADKANFSTQIEVLNEFKRDFQNQQGLNDEMAASNLQSGVDGLIGAHAQIVTFLKRLIGSGDVKASAEFLKLSDDNSLKQSMRSLLESLEKNPVHLAGKARPKPAADDLEGQGRRVREVAGALGTATMNDPVKVIEFMNNHIYENDLPEKTTQGGSQAAAELRKTFETMISEGNGDRFERPAAGTASSARQRLTQGVRDQLKDFLSGFGLMRGESVSKNAEGFFTAYMSVVRGAYEKAGVERTVQMLNRLGANIRMPNPDDDDEIQKLLLAALKALVASGILRADQFNRDAFTHLAELSELLNQAGIADITQDNDREELLGLLRTQNAFARAAKHLRARLGAYYGLVAGRVNAFDQDEEDRIFEIQQADNERRLDNDLFRLGIASEGAVQTRFYTDTAAKRMALNHARQERKNTIAAKVAEKPEDYARDVQAADLLKQMSLKNPATGLEPDAFERMLQLRMAGGQVSFEGDRRIYGEMINALLAYKNLDANSQALIRSGKDLELFIRSFDAEKTRDKTFGKIPTPESIGKAAIRAAHIAHYSAREDLIRNDELYRAVIEREMVSVPLAGTLGAVIRDWYRYGRESDEFENTLIHTSPRAAFISRQLQYYFDAEDSAAQLKTLAEMQKRMLAHEDSAEEKEAQDIEKNYLGRKAQMIKAESDIRAILNRGKASDQVIRASIPLRPDHLDEVGRVNPKLVKDYQRLQAEVHDYEGNMTENAAYARRRYVSLLEFTRAKQARGEQLNDSEQGMLKNLRGYFEGEIYASKRAKDGMINALAEEDRAAMKTAIDFVNAKIQAELEKVLDQIEGNADWKNSPEGLKKAMSELRDTLAEGIEIQEQGEAADTVAFVRGGKIHVVRHYLMKLHEMKMRGELDDEQAALYLMAFIFHENVERRLDQKQSRLDFKENELRDLTRNILTLAGVSVSDSLDIDDVLVTDEILDAANRKQNGIKTDFVNLRAIYNSIHASGKDDRGKAERDIMAEGTSSGLMAYLNQATHDRMVKAFDVMGDDLNQKGLYAAKMDLYQTIKKNRDAYLPALFDGSEVLTEQKRKALEPLVKYFGVTFVGYYFEIIEAVKKNNFTLAESILNSKYALNRDHLARFKPEAEISYEAYHELQNWINRAKQSVKGLSNIEADVAAARFAGEMTDSFYQSLAYNYKQFSNRWTSEMAKEKLQPVLDATKSDDDRFEARRKQVADARRAQVASLKADGVNLESGQPVAITEKAAKKLQDMFKKRKNRIGDADPKDVSLDTLKKLSVVLVPAEKDAGEHAELFADLYRIARNLGIPVDSEFALFTSATGAEWAGIANDLGHNGATAWADSGEDFSDVSNVSDDFKNGGLIFMQGDRVLERALKRHASTVVHESTHPMQIGQSAAAHAKDNQHGLILVEKVREFQAYLAQFMVGEMTLDQLKRQLTQAGMHEYLQQDYRDLQIHDSEEIERLREIHVPVIKRLADIVGFYIDHLEDNLDLVRRLLDRWVLPDNSIDLTQILTQANQVATVLSDADPMQKIMEGETDAATADKKDKPTISEKMGAKELVRKLSADYQHTYQIVKQRKDPEDLTQRKVIVDLEKDQSLLRISALAWLEANKKDPALSAEKILKEWTDWLRADSSHGIFIRQSYRDGKLLIDGMRPVYPFSEMKKDSKNSAMADLILTEPKVKTGYVRPDESAYVLGADQYASEAFNAANELETLKQLSRRVTVYGVTASTNELLKDETIQVGADRNGNTAYRLENQKSIEHKKMIERLMASLEDKKLQETAAAEGEEPISDRIIPGKPISQVAAMETEKRSELREKSITEDVRSALEKKVARAANESGVSVLAPDWRWANSDEQLYFTQGQLGLYADNLKQIVMNLQKFNGLEVGTPEYSVMVERMAIAILNHEQIHSEQTGLSAEELLLRIAKFAPEFDFSVYAFNANMLKEIEAYFSTLKGMRESAYAPTFAGEIELIESLLMALQTDSLISADSRKIIEEMILGATGVQAPFSARVGKPHAQVLVFAKDEAAASFYQNQPGVTVKVGLDSLISILGGIELRGDLAHTAILLVGFEDSEITDNHKKYAQKASLIRVTKAMAQTANKRVVMTGWLAAWFGTKLFKEHFWKRDEQIMAYENLINTALKMLVDEMLNAQKIKISA